MSKLMDFYGTNFVGRELPVGFGIQFYLEDDGSISTTTVFDETKQGAPGILHGGAIAAVLDEAMGAACFGNGHPGFTATMTYNYASHIPLNVEVKIRAWIEKIEGKKVFAACETILPDGTIPVTGTGLFIKSDKLRQMIEQANGFRTDGGI